MFTIRFPDGREKQADGYYLTDHVREKLLSAGAIIIPPKSEIPETPKFTIRVTDLNGKVTVVTCADKKYYLLSPLAKQVMLREAHVIEVDSYHLFGIPQDKKKLLDQYNRLKLWSRFGANSVKSASIEALKALKDGDYTNYLYRASMADYKFNEMKTNSTKRESAKSSSNDEGYKDVSELWGW